MQVTPNHVTPSAGKVEFHHSLIAYGILLLIALLAYWHPGFVEPPGWVMTVVPAVCAALAGGIAIAFTMASFSTRRAMAGSQMRISTAADEGASPAPVSREEIVNAVVQRLASSLAAEEASRQPGLGVRPPAGASDRPS